MGDGGSFKVGDRVRHPVFGDGLVLHVAPRGKDVALKISFSKDGAQRLMLAAAARLEKLDSDAGAKH
jgi:DNA helicase II / ATP-dependent DNA helicase PcrA